jgi:hypothetical protein
VTGDLSLKWRLGLTTEGIAAVTAKDWEGYCQHVEQLKQQYWERDRVVADVIDTIIIANPNDRSYVEEMSSEDDDESEEATDFSDSDLARPLLGNLKAILIITHESLLSVVCSVVVEQMLSGWLVATRHTPRNLAHACKSRS